VKKIIEKELFNKIQLIDVAIEKLFSINLLR